jgi:hypothetical protein
MTKVLRLVSVCCFLHLMGAGPARSTPPGPGQHFDCSDAPGATSCATDDAGCVSNTKDHRACAQGLIVPFGKAVKRVSHCHVKQASTRSKGTPADAADATEDGCELKAATALSGAIVAVTPICDPVQISGAQQKATDLFGAGPPSFDQMNGSIYCDSTSGALIGGDDTGWVPANHDMLRCEGKVGLNLAKLTAFGLKCQRKMNNNFFRGRDFDEEACETHALAKYNRVRDFLVAQCAQFPCLDQAHQDAAAAAVISQFDGSDSSRFFPCGLSSPSGAFLDTFEP